MSRKFGGPAIAFLVAILVMLPLAAQAGDAHDALDKGPKIGAAIPQPFQAVDQNGKAQDFGSIVGKRGLVLLFSRSLGW